MPQRLPGGAGLRQRKDGSDGRGRERLWEEHRSAVRGVGLSGPQWGQVQVRLPVLPRHTLGKNPQRNNRVLSAGGK